MTTTRHPSCDLAGTGTINRTVPFRLLDISSEKIHVAADARLRMRNRVKLALELSGGLFVVRIKSDGIVSGKKDGSYEIRFSGLSENDREEIETLVTNSCDL